MKKLIFILTLISQLTNAQSKGIVTGTLMDGSLNNESLPFANVYIKGTTIGSTTDMDGKYSISVDPGKRLLVFSFVGYKTIEKEIIVEAGKTLAINEKLLINTGITLDEIKINAVVNRAKVNAILLSQKKAISIKSSIGAQELINKGISDLSNAVTKVTGISKQQGSENVFVRGLGDRYNSTTLNGLPLPSNNPSRKNISLHLFSTDIISLIDVNKIYSSDIYGDFGGANINIVSKEHIGKSYFEIGLGSSTNSNVLNQDQFYLQDGPNNTGFYNSNYPKNPLTGYNFITSWNNQTTSPIASDIAIKGGKKFDIGKAGRISVFGTASFKNGFQYKEGLQRGNVNKQGLVYTDYQFTSYDYTTNSTAMVNATFKANENNTYQYNSLYINSTNQSLNEYNGIISLFDNAGNGGGYVKRATFERTSFFVNQLLGNHKLNEKLAVDWGVAYNSVNNIIPDRKQNMLVPQSNTSATGPKIVSTLASSDNNRFFQELTENEAAINLAANYSFSKASEDNFKGKLSIGYSGRFKKVDFNAIQFNFRINKSANQPVLDINNLDAYFNQNSIINNYFKIETFRGDAAVSGSLRPQIYTGNQYVNAGFASVQYQFNQKFSAVFGLRVEHLFQDIQWDTALGSGSNDFSKIEILPSTSLKYKLTEKQNLKLGISKSYTLPQFKERAPFQFEEVAQIKFGNPAVSPSTNYNADIRWEYFPKRNEVISFTSFGKIIQNPINEVVVASATNDISYVNTGKQATIFGAEFEIKKQLFSFDKGTKDGSLANKLTTGFNASYMYSHQDFNSQKVSDETNLNVNFTNTEGKLTGASSLILNADLSYFKQFSTIANLSSTLSYNYFSDRVYAIGSAGKGDIIDKAVGSLDLVIKSQLSKRIKLGLSVKNILNPAVKRVQEAQNVAVLSYKNGINAGLSFSYQLD